MFDLFGNNNRKSLKQMMDEINEMFGDYNPNFNSSSMEHKTETGSENGLDWEKETYSLIKCRPGDGRNGDVLVTNVPLIRMLIKDSNTFINFFLKDILTYLIKNKTI